jgi:hypothetical protein
MNTIVAGRGCLPYPTCRGREDGSSMIPPRARLSQGRAAGHMLLPGGVSGRPPRWRRECAAKANKHEGKSQPGIALGNKQPECVQNQKGGLPWIGLGKF